MKLIWNELLHANFRCGRMCGERAEEFTVTCTMPSCARMLYADGALNRSKRK